MIMMDMMMVVLYLTGCLKSRAALRLAVDLRRE